MDAAIEADEEEFVQEVIPDEEVGMGGPQGRVYWPPSMEDWLRPVKKVVKKKDPAEKQNGKLTPAKKRKAADDAAKSAVKLEGEVQEDGDNNTSVATPTPAKKAKVTPKESKKNGSSRKKAAVNVPTPEVSESEGEESMPNFEEEGVRMNGNTKTPPTRKSARAKKVSYTEENEDGE